MGRKGRKNRSKKGGAASAATPPAPAAKASKKRAAPQGPSERQQTIGRIAAMGLGIVFILAGTLKVADPWVFLGSLPAYGVPSFLRVPVTVIMPTLEVVLGIMLIAGWRTRLASTVSAGILAAFSAVIAYGWAMGTLQDCGCFGPMLKRTPPEALAQDAVFIGMAVLGLMWAPVTKMEFTRFRAGTLASAAVIAVAMISGTLWSDTQTLEERIAAAEPAVAGEMPTLESLDLRNRDVFLYLFHPDCQYCVRNGPQLKLLAEDATLPEIIGITHSVTPGEVKGYLDHAGADIKAYTFNPASFAQITGSGAVPQLVYLRRGRRERVWQGDLPGSVELRRVVNGASN